MMKSWAGGVNRGRHANRARHVNHASQTSQTSPANHASQVGWAALIFFVWIQMSAGVAFAVQVDRQCSRPSFASSEFAQRLRLEVTRREGFDAHEKAVAEEQARIARGIPAYQAQLKKEAAAYEEARMDYVRERDQLQAQMKRRRKIAYAQYQHEQQMRKASAECSRQNYVTEQRRYEELLNHGKSVDGSDVYRGF